MKPYYEDSSCVIYNADCRDILPEVPYADVMVTDPPYGVNLGKHSGAKKTRKKTLIKQGYASYDDTIENFKSVVVPALLLALSKVDRAVVFAADRNLQLLPQFDALGGVFNPAGMGRGRWGFVNFSCCALYGTAPDLATKGARATSIRSAQTADKGILHPCPKPYEWMAWAVMLSSRPNELVIDPFMGSGTTLQACKNLGRKCIGIEIEEKYCEQASKRLRQGVLGLL